MATITGKPTHVGQIVKEVTHSAAGAVTGPVFEMFHKKELTVSVFLKSSSGISSIKLMRLMHDGTSASQEAVSTPQVTAGNGVTFAVSYNVPKFRIDYTSDSSDAAVVFIEVEGGY